MYYVLLITLIILDRLARTPGTPSGSSGKNSDANVPSPFSTPVHSNPAFNPQKMGGTKGVCNSL